MRIPRTDVRCEVLIIGGGLAALVAALEAKKLVDEVVIFLRESGPGHSRPRTLSACSDYPHAVLGLSTTQPLLQRFIFRYDERGEMATPDVMSQVLFTELAEVSFGLKAKQVSYSNK